MLDCVIKFLNELESVISCEGSQPNDWTDQRSLTEAYGCVVDCFNAHFEVGKNSLAYIFTDELGVEDNTEHTVTLIQRWHNGDDKISVPALASVALAHMGFSGEQDAALIRGVLVAAILAEVPNKLFYHNNLHFKKVVLHIVRMIVAHNNIFADTNHSLDKPQIAALLVASAIHDLGHQGKGNLQGRTYEMAKTEKRSFDLAAPYLKGAGVSDELLAQVRTMLIGTDVSPFGDPISPANQVRAAYEYHYGEAEDTDVLELSEDLAVLEQDADLCMMCLMLHEADIMNSAGLSYEITCQESILVSKEIGRPHASPEDTLLFLEKICCGNLLSDSARFLASDNLQKILVRVMQDFKNGNVSYF